MPRKRRTPEELALLPPQPPVRPIRTKDWDEDLIRRILEAISNGTSVRAACEAERLDVVTFRSWVVVDFHSLGAHYARARDSQAESWADEILVLADMIRMGESVRTLADGSKETITRDMVDRAKLQIDARKWLLAKLHPKRYGEHQPVAPPMPFKRAIRVNPFGREIEQNGHVTESNGNSGHNGNGNGSHAHLSAH